MNWYSQLTRLILDFYRENPDDLEALESLQMCKLSRRWGVFRVNCQDAETAATIIDAVELLREPILQLRLAQTIKVLVGRRAIATFPVNVTRIDHRSYGERQS